MAVSLENGLVGVALLAGTVLCWLGGHCYRRWDEPGANGFATVAAVLGLTAVASGAVALAGGTEVPEARMPLWRSVALTGWVVSMVPWILFSLRYTGRVTAFRLRTAGLISVPVVGIVGLIAIQSSGHPTVLTQLLATFSLLYVFALVAVGSYLLLRTSYEFGHLSTWQGVSLTLAGTAPLVLINSIGTMVGRTSDATIFAVYALAFAVPAVCLTLSVVRFGMFQSTPAAGALGERAIPRETDDLVVVVDREGRVIKINETAAERLGVDPTDPLGGSFASLVGRTVDELRETDTVELATAVGNRRFDPQVTAFTDQHGRQLGSLLSLRDVTERELRKQRLEVLNRVLRHNLRNRVDAIKGNAEAIEAESSDGYAAEIRESADELATLSAKAREIDQLVSRPTRYSEADLSAVVRELAAATGDDRVIVDVPERAPLVTDWEALRLAVRSAVENAVEHAAESVTATVERSDSGYVITVADDGPGIPDSELDSLDAETETPLQHGTGLGLWLLKWSVRKLNGTLSFDTSGGTTVRLTVPDRSE
ncbi:ATP-binding protein [Halostella litorea]|uniref:ATP-binding protein n=1 Tax=Halostella litorea TaxID=2528831 RepID=UPI0010918D54|nr:ATP-binding protein [Halostella litorea]